MLARLDAIGLNWPFNRVGDVYFPPLSDRSKVFAKVTSATRPVCSSAPLCKQLDHFVDLRMVARSASREDQRSYKGQLAASFGTERGHAPALSWRVTHRCHPPTCTTALPSQLLSSASWQGFQMICSRHRQRALRHPPHAPRPRAQHGQRVRCGCDVCALVCCVRCGVCCVPGWV